MRNLSFLVLALSACGVETDAVVDPADLTADDSTAATAEEPAATYVRCANELSDEDFQMIEAENREILGEGYDQDPWLSVGAVSVNVPVYVHVITPNNGNTGVTNGMINDQIDVLNAEYQAAGAVFTLANVDYTANSTWYTGCMGGSESSMKRALHTGGVTDLNLYLCSPNGGLLGLAAFPWDYARNSSLDGVVVLDESLPGGNAYPFDAGMTAVHEVGHWFGLYHTFQGGCAANGDRVSDTPPERSPTYGCPRSRDTCGGGGSDPFHNFMDYSDDSCLTEFTTAQITRMRTMYATYR